METVLAAKGLTKRFGTQEAVSDLSFGVERGDVYGFLGENGAGKSTTMRMLVGLITPTSGTVEVMGQEMKRGNTKALEHMGAMIERPDMYRYLTGLDNLKYFGALGGKKVTPGRLAEVLEMVGLTGREGDKVHAYSQGMKQRLGIAIALVNDPEILILDEPSNGLDPQGIADMRTLITRLSQEHGKTILISSHLLHEIELMATRMLIIHKGKKMAEGRVSELLNADENLVELGVEDAERYAAMMGEGNGAGKVTEVSKDKIVMKMNPGAVPEVVAWLAKQGARITRVETRHSLEAYFLSLTK